VTKNYRLENLFRMDTVAERARTGWFYR